MSIATIKWIGGPVVRATTREPFALREAVYVGESRLPGEVIRIDGDEITLQVYEDTTGLRTGLQIEGTGRPLSVTLGPHLLGGTFDGLLRPLADTGAPYVLPGWRPIPAQTFRFSPTVSKGQMLKGGAALGAAHDGERMQLVLVPPDVSGEVMDVSPPGEYPDDAPLVTLRTANGDTRLLSMRQEWPVRTPRPFSQHLASDEPLLTGQRIVDSMFPVARGGRAVIPGGFGTGKTVFLETLARWCNADVIVYVGCGERGNEIAGMLEEFPQLEDPRTGRKLMERTVVIANTSNMPVSAREASIYTGMTVAEFFRDQGLHVAVMADSSSRWAEALREVSGRLGELPGESAYPAYLSSRLAEFYERAGRVRSLAGSEGSITVMGAISPASGDFSEPVTMHSKRYVRNFWALDTKRAQARFFPAIHPLQSYSEDVESLAGWWRVQGHAQWSVWRRRFLALLEEHAHLERMARILGKDAMPPRAQLTLLCAELMNEGFLRQSAFSITDRYCSPGRQTAMMKLLARFLDLADEAVAGGISPEQVARLPEYRRVSRMGEDLGEDALERYAELEKDIEAAFLRLKEKANA